LEIILKNLLIAVCLWALSASLAADFSIDVPFSFGEIAVRNNSSVSTVTISRHGIQQSTNQILILKTGAPGVFTVSGLHPYTIINLSVDLPAHSAMPYPNTAQFELTSVDIPSSVNLGPTGSAQFKMGGTLSTSGNPSEHYYSGGQYVIYVNLNLDY
jgi:hypothetical protein